MREKFPDEKSSEKLDDKTMEKLSNVKVILVNAPCSKSALMNPMDFLFQEGAGDITKDNKRVLLILNTICIQMSDFCVTSQLITKMRKEFQTLSKKRNAC